MGTGAPGGEPRHGGRPPVTAADRDDRSARLARRSEPVLTQADFTRFITVMQTTASVERDLAQTLRAMAAHGSGDAGARRLKLAEEADRGAQAADQHSRRLGQHARWWDEHADAATLGQVLEHAGRVLAGLARTENHIAVTLTGLACSDGSDQATRRRQLAAQASAAARHARQRAQTLRRLAPTDAATTDPRRAPRAGTPGPAQPDLPAPRRPAPTGRRPGGPQQATPERPADDPAPQVRGDPQWFARQTRRYWQQSAARSPRLRQRTVDALGRAASAHDRAAQGHEKSARAGIGDVAAHQRRAAFHRAAAEADRQQAQQIHDQAVTAAQQSPKTSGPAS